MSKFYFDINNSEVKDYTKRLAQMHKSDLPIVIRQTINDLAFDTKQKTLYPNYKKQFTVRNETFLKSQSGVTKATGFNISDMESVVGITPRGIGGEAAAELTKQEVGGVKVKSMVYMKQARGGSNKKLVSNNKYHHSYEKIKGEHANVTRHTRKSNFIASAIMAHRLGKILFWKSKTGETAFLINSVYLGAKNVAKVNATPIADYEENRSFKLKARPFLYPASNMSINKQYEFFRKNAAKRFKK